MEQSNSFAPEHPALKNVHPELLHIRESPSFQENLRQVWEAVGGRKELQQLKMQKKKIQMDAIKARLKHRDSLTYHEQLEEFDAKIKQIEDSITQIDRLVAIKHRIINIPVMVAIAAKLRGNKAVYESNYSQIQWSELDKKLRKDLEILFSENWDHPTIKKRILKILHMLPDHNKQMENIHAKLVHNELQGALLGANPKKNASPLPVPLMAGIDAFNSLLSSTSGATINEVVPQEVLDLFDANIAILFDRKDEWFHAKIGIGSAVINRWKNRLHNKQKIQLHYIINVLQ